MRFSYRNAQQLFCLRACLKNHSRLHAPLCGIFHPNSVAVARYGAIIRQNIPQIVTHILQKAFFRHTLSRLEKTAFLRLIFQFDFLFQNHTSCHISDNVNAGCAHIAECVDADVNTHNSCRQTCHGCKGCEGCDGTARDSREFLLTGVRLPEGL